ncbi:hypothetical protein [Listeria booriae]|uniref:hypothetical protein n=1 Tax=Listeria booriae TaxID=1552123 RepID=UPI00162997B8|nr:hypothetical protein [Listeria booriae]MBC2363990.1 hypothetical protein [Listeria booriae]
MNKKKISIILMTGMITLSSFVPFAQASENVGEKNLFLDSAEVVSVSQSLAEELVLEKPMLRANVTDGGGSAYVKQTVQIVDLRTTNNMYKALLAAGLAVVFKGATVAGSMAGSFGASTFNNYRWMRQTIYKKQDSKYVYYKVIDEFTNNKTTWKGYVQTTETKVTR